MTTPPRPKKPKPLVIKPGKYRTRGGAVAIVATKLPGEILYPWYGSIGREGSVTWTKEGQRVAPRETIYDLVKRLPDAKPKRTAKRKAQYGMWVPCTDRGEAVLHLNHWRAGTLPFIWRKAFMRILPVAQRRAGKGGK